jgi:hypothetical protein
LRTEVGIAQLMWMFIRRLQFDEIDDIHQVIFQIRRIIKQESNGSRLYLSRLQAPPTLDEVQHHNNNGYYQQDMDKSSHGVTADQPEPP